ncbi:MAG: glutathione S-transferase family protein [Betaproteobacteria bacterium]|nr:glutathione S-transferase family protein [Betaproteobacteria bacterium]
MITLHTFGPALGQPDPSPFVMKAMLLLKLAGQPYTEAPFAGPGRMGPKGKRPFLLDDGQVVADSTFIRFHLENKYGADWDAHLSEQQRGVTWALEKMCEEHLYFALMYFRWLKEDNFRKGPATFFDRLPGWIRPVVRTLVRNNMRKLLLAQGMGRHSEAEIASLAVRDIDALAGVLGDADWFGGAAPCAADASIGAFVLSGLCELFDSPLLLRLKQHRNLVAYAERVQSRFFS